MSLKNEMTKYLNEAKVKDIMSKEVVTVDVDASFSEVPKKMKEFSIRHIPIINKEKRLVGLITQRMMYKIKSPRKLMDGEWYYDEEMLNNVILEHVMVREVSTLYADDSVGTALLKIVHSRFGSIPIVDKDNILLGIVTRRDILKVAADIYEN